VRAFISKFVSTCLVSSAGRATTTMANTFDVFETYGTSCTIFRYIIFNAPGVVEMSSHANGPADVIYVRVIEMITVITIGIDDGLRRRGRRSPVKTIFVHFERLRRYRDFVRENYFCAPKVSFRFRIFGAPCFSIRVSDAR